MKLQNLTLILIVITCFGILPKAQAVSPSPDGGYAGGNTAEGQSALLSLTTGTYNTAIGLFSLLSDTQGSFNTGVGAGTLLVNTGDENTATGAGALLSNTIGAGNTADGTFALFSNTEGIDNTASGVAALLSNDTGSFNTADGLSALHENTSGGFNTADGVDSLFENTTGSGNTAVGSNALAGITTGNFNTALGQNAGDHLATSDSNNIDIGANVEGVAGESNTIRIGNPDITTTIIRGISGVTIASGTAVLVAANGQLGTMTSSKRFKDEIKPMGKASEAILALKPIMFRYKKEIDPAGIQQFGLVAEDVEKVNPDLVVRDETGKVNSVRYEQVNAMLLNEFIKEHRKMGEQDGKIRLQEATIARLQSDAAKQDAIISELKEDIGALTAQLKKQAVQIQKVSTQVEFSKAARNLADTSQ